MKTTSPPIRTMKSVSHEVAAAAVRPVDDIFSASRVSDPTAEGGTPIRPKASSLGCSMRGIAATIVILIGAALLAFAPTSAFGDDPDNCLFCHQYRGLSYYNKTNDTSHVFFVQPEYVHQRQGPHAVIACTDCHVKSEVLVVPHLPVTKVDCTKACHIGKPGALEQRFSHRNIAEMLPKGIHTTEVLEKAGAIKGSLLSTGQSQCLYCHDEPVFRDPTGAIPLLKELGSRTFDRCDVCHSRQNPADTAYYLKHMAARLQPARAPLEMAQVCAVCHSDPAVCEQFKMTDAVGSYVRSYHGKAALLGDEKTANCMSCHIAAGANVHLMLKPENPASSVSAARVANTCRNSACHPGADAPLGAASVHLDLPSIRGNSEFWMALAFILLTIATFGPSMVICILELVPGALGWKAHHDPRMERITRAVLAHPEGRKRLIRFTVAQRIQHWILAILFTFLAITGFPLKFADRGWSRWVIDQFGGLNNARLIHHWGGVLLVIGLGVHVLYILWTMWHKHRQALHEGRRMGVIQSILSLPLFIGPRDLLDFVHLLAYLVRLRKERPTFGRFSIKEKFEYIGVFWGTILLGATGFLLWGMETSSHFMTGRALNFALIGHTYEAFLAIIHVGILHIVNVMLSPNVFPISPATITGETPIAELSEGHSEQVLEVAGQLGLNIEKDEPHQ